MDTYAYAPLIIIAAIAIYAIFSALRQRTGASSSNEIEEAHIAEAHSAEVQHAAHVAKSDTELADRLLPSHAEAMIIPLGAPMDREYATFEGSLSEVRQQVVSLPIAEREHIAIWTPGHIFDAAGFLAELPGHEHDPLPPL